LRERASVYIVSHVLFQQTDREDKEILTLTNSLPPNILNRARSLTVNTFNLVGTNNDVLQGTTVLDDEDCIRVAALVLARAGNATAVGLHSTVKGLAGDLVGLVEGDAALGFGEREGVPLCHFVGVGAGAVHGQRAGGEGEDEAVFDEHCD
jgi:hypothetical protein